jgi:hypothetical protein
LLPKFPKEPYFYGDEHGTHRIAVLDWVSKEYSLAILKEIAI